MIGDCDETDYYHISVVRGSEVKKARSVKCVKCLVFMGWQGTFNLCFMLFLSVADPEIPLQLKDSSLWQYLKQLPLTKFFNRLQKKIKNTVFFYLLATCP